MVGQQRWFIISDELQVFDIEMHPCASPQALAPFTNFLTDSSMNSA